MALRNISNFDAQKKRLRTHLMDQLKGRYERYEQQLINKGEGVTYTD